MANPRVYFKIFKGCLVPTVVTSRELYSIMSTQDSIDRNIAQYNTYTLAFINAHADSENVFYSENYYYNSTLRVFNFIKICEATNADFAAMVNHKSEFDMHKTYMCDAPSVDENKITLIQEINRDVPCPSVDEGFYFDKKQWNFLVRNIKRHQNTMLVGPTGTGKTDVIIRICEKLGIPCRIYDMGAMMDPLTDLLGSHRLENGSSKFDFAKFVYDVQTPGVILLDELSRAPMMTNNILFPCLDMRRELPIDIADSNSERRIKIHKDVTFIATANIGPEYSGTSDIDAALANRFMIMQVDYLTAPIETNILIARTGIDETNASRIINIANNIRERYKAGALSKPVSTRETIACAEMFVDGFTMFDAIDFAFCGKYLKYNGGTDENSIVKKIIAGF